jgi:hypothetical protein
MRFGLITAAAVAALAFGAETASAQVIIPHKNHFHVVPAKPIVPFGYTPGYGLGYGVYSQPQIIGNPFYQPNYFGSPVLVPHTTTHLHAIPHKGHVHLVPHTTTHFHVRRW